MCVSSSFPHLQVHLSSSLSCIYCDESKRLWQTKRNHKSHMTPYSTWFKDFISSKCLFFSNVALPHNVFHQQRKKKLPSFTQRDLQMRSHSCISSIQPPSSPCQQGHCSANSHTSSWAAAARPAAVKNKAVPFQTRFQGLLFFFFLTVSDFALWHPFHWSLTDWFELYSGLSRKIILHAGEECSNSQNSESAPRHTYEIILYVFKQFIF